MKYKTVEFTVLISIASDDGERSWQKDVRWARKILKEQIGSIPDVKIIKIDTKEK
jgi:hypothetical protein